MITITLVLPVLLSAIQKLGAACLWSIGEKSPLRCAGLNRYEAENEKVLRGRISNPLGPEFCVGAPRGAQRSINRGIGGLGYRAPKRCNQDADAVVMCGRQHEQRR